MNSLLEFIIWTFYRDLEHAVEELRSDVLSRQCRVQMSDVEGMALVLSHVTKALGDLKGKIFLLMLYINPLPQIDDL